MMMRKKKKVWFLNAIEVGFFNFLDSTENLYFGGKVYVNGEVSYWGVIIKQNGAAVN